MQTSPAREDALDAACTVFDESTRSKAVTLACDHARRDVRAKEETLRFLAGELDLETFAEVVALLDTSTMPISFDARVEDVGGELELLVDVDVGRGHVDA